MSRSYYKSRLCPVTAAKSEKFLKRVWHKRFRRCQNNNIHQKALEDTDYSYCPRKEEVFDDWKFMREFLMYVSPLEVIQMCKNYPECKKYYLTHFTRDFKRRK